MKNISLILVVLVIAYFNVSCDRTYKGKADIKGVLMYKCGSNDPMGNVTVSLTAGATLLSATTDANGYFHINGPYEYTTRKEISPRLEITSNGQNGGGFGSIILLEDAPDTFNDTIYMTNTMYSILIIDTKGSTFGSETDTLRFQYQDMDDFPNTNQLKTLKYAGPFTDGQILDTLNTRASTHVGYPLYYTRPTRALYLNDVYDIASLNPEQYPFIPEQPNTCGEYIEFYISFD
mgnify:CR=1 FL=1